MRYLEFVCETCGKSFVTPQGEETVVRYEYVFCPICGGDLRLKKERGAKDVVPGALAWFECALHWMVIGVKPEQADEVWKCPVCGDHDGINRLDDGEMGYVRKLAGGREEEESEHAEAGFD